MRWVEPEPIGLVRPDLVDELVGREATQRLQPERMVVGLHEELEVSPELVVAVIVIAPDGRLLERVVHPLELTVIRHDGFGALTSR